MPTIRPIALYLHYCPECGAGVVLDCYSERAAEGLLVHFPRCRGRQSQLIDLTDLRVTYEGQECDIVLIPTKTAD